MGSRRLSNSFASPLGLNVIGVEASIDSSRNLRESLIPKKSAKRSGGIYRRFRRGSQKKTSLAASQEGLPVKFLVQGTLYPDVIESVSVKGPSAVIKTHHNVGGLPERDAVRV